MWYNIFGAQYKKDAEKTKTKSMKQFLQGVYINATKGAAISFVIFCGAAFLLPEPQQNEGYELVLTISTFLFAIIAGFLFRA